MCVFLLWVKAHGYSLKTTLYWIPLEIGENVVVPELLSHVRLFTTSWTTACQFITVFYFKDLLQGSLLKSGSRLEEEVTVLKKCIFGLVENYCLVQDLNLKSIVGGMWLKSLKGGDLSLNVKCNSFKGTNKWSGNIILCAIFFQKDSKWAVILKWSCRFKTGFTTYLESWNMPQCSWFHSLARE